MPGMAKNEVPEAAASAIVWTWLRPKIASDSDTLLTLPESLKKPELDNCNKRTVNAGHETNALAVANKQVDVATNNTENLDKLKTSAPEKLKELKVIWKSPLIPGDPIVWRKNLSETTKDKIYDFFMNYGKTPEEKAVLERLGWAPFRASSDLQLVPIRQLALFKEMQGVKSNKGLNEQDKLAKTTEIQAQLDDLDRLNNALSAMSSVSKAVQ